jgi:hypothetical protein
MPLPASKNQQIKKKNFKVIKKANIKESDNSVKDSKLQEATSPTKENVERNFSNLQKKPENKFPSYQNPYSKTLNSKANYSAQEKDNYRIEKNSQEPKEDISYHHLENKENLEENKLQTEQTETSTLLRNLIIIVTLASLIFLFYRIFKPDLQAYLTYFNIESAYQKIPSDPEKVSEIIDTQRKVNANLLNKSSLSKEKVVRLASQNLINNLKAEDDIFSIKTPNRSNLEDVDFQALKQKVIKLMAEKSEKHAIYVYDLKRQQGFSYRAKEEMVPGSISKLPVAMLTMKAIEKGTLSLESQITIQDNLKNGELYPMYNYPAGSKHSLKAVMRHLLVDSDNTAMLHLENLHGGVLEYNRKVKDELGLDPFYRMPHIVTAQQVGKFFEDLYKGQTLSRSNSDYILDLLSVKHKWNQDRIDLALRGYGAKRIAHKIGNLGRPTGSTYQDGGIVWGSKTDFVIIVLNKDMTVDECIRYNHIITRAVYEELNK